MKTITLTLAMIVASLGVAQAQAQPPEKEIDIEARERSISVMEKRVNEREAQLTGIANEIIELHKRVDGKLAKLVERLAGIKDSTKSGFRISKLKMDAIVGLRKSVEDYQSKRAEVIRVIREGRSGVPKETLEEEAKHFDEHIEKHLEQVLTISKSFTQDENVEKYKRIGGGGGSSSWDGWDYDLYEISDEWYQNRRDRVMNKKQRKEAIDALQNSVKRCESLIAGLRNNLENNKLTNSDQELMRSELNRHLRMKDKRQGQLEDLIVVDMPATKPLNRDAALDLEDALKDQTADLQRDLETIFFKHAQLNRERPNFYKLKANLAARKKWLAEYEKKWIEDFNKEANK